MIKDINIIPGCISCRTCETVCPSNFQVAPKSRVISKEFTGHETEILMAEAMCPVQVIKVDKKAGVSLNFREETLLEKNKLTSDIFEFVLTKPKNFNYKAGQYVSVMFEDWKGKFSRQYSICEVTETTFSLTVRLYEKGRGSQKLKKLKAGKTVKFLGPLGGFVLQENQKEKYFISTGTGLAPFIAMAQKLPDSAKKHFLIGGRTEEELYFQDKVEAFANIKVHYFLSRDTQDFSQKNTENTSYDKGRVTEYLGKIPQDAEVYICGNPNMVQQVREDLLKVNFSKTQIFSEDFTVSGKYAPLWKEIFVNGNIPFKNCISWGLILIGFALAGIVLYREFIGISQYDNFLIFGGLQTFIYKVSWWSVVFLMLIRPISDILPKNALLRKLKYFRKPLGILSSVLIAMSFAAKYIVDPSALVQYFTSINRWNNSIALNARISEWTAIILLFTSSAFAQKKMGAWWKRVQYLSYPYFFTGMIAATLYIEEFGEKLWYYILFGIWIVLWIGAFVKNRKKD